MLAYLRGDSSRLRLTRSWSLQQDRDLGVGRISCPWCEGSSRECAGNSAAATLMDAACGSLATSHVVHDAHLAEFRYFVYIPYKGCTFWSPSQAYIISATPCHSFSGWHAATTHGTCKHNLAYNLVFIRISEPANSTKFALIILTKSCTTRPEHLHPIAYSAAMRTPPSYVRTRAC